MHVLIATDGSRQSLRAARHFKSFADPTKVEQILVLAVTRPLASVSFVDEISADAKAPRQLTGSSFKAEAEAAVAVIAGGVTSRIIEMPTGMKPIARPCSARQATSASMVGASTAARLATQ